MFINASHLSNTFVLKTLLKYVDEVAIAVNICVLNSETMRPCRYEFRGNRMDVDKVDIKSIQGALTNVEVEDYYIHESNGRRVFRVNTKRQYQLV